MKVSEDRQKHRASLQKDRASLRYVVHKDFTLSELCNVFDSRLQNDWYSIEAGTQSSMASTKDNLDSDISSSVSSLEWQNVWEISPRELAVMGFNLTAVGFILSNVHFEGVMPMYVPGAYLIPQIHHILAATFLFAGVGASVVAICRGKLFTPGLAFLLIGSILTNLLNFHY